MPTGSLLSGNGAVPHSSLGDVPGKPRAMASQIWAPPINSLCQSAVTMSPASRASRRTWAGLPGLLQPVSSRSGAGDGAWSGRTPCAAAPASSSGVKPSRLCTAGGPSSALNPAGASRDGTETAFSRADIHEAVKESVAAWEQHDLKEALR